VVTELLFDLPLPRFPRLHWRVFIEVNTCSVLYLRALIASYTGSVYVTDPNHGDGQQHDHSLLVGRHPRSVAHQRHAPRPNCDYAAAPHGKLCQSIEGFRSVPAATVVSPQTDFNYSVPTPNFAAVCAYHHLDELFRLVMSFGYSPITTFSKTRRSRCQSISLKTTPTSKLSRASMQRATGSGRSLAASKKTAARSALRLTGAF